MPYNVTVLTCLTCSDGQSGLSNPVFTSARVTEDMDGGEVRASDDRSYKQTFDQGIFNVIK